MTYFSLEVRDSSTSQLNRVLIVSTVDRQVHSLFTAGGSPEPMSRLARVVIDELSLSTPEDLAGAEMANSLSYISPPVAHGSFAEALAAADTLLADAQGGREPRPDLPSDIAFEVRALASSVSEVQAELIKQLRRLESMYERLETKLWRGVELPDRHKQALTSAQPETADSYTHVLELLAVSPERPSEARLIEESPLASRIKAALRKAGISTLEQLEALSSSELAGLNGIGRGAVKEIEALLRPPSPAPKARRATRRESTKAKKPVTVDRLTGRVTALREKYAFVKPDDGSEDVFLHAGSVPALAWHNIRVGQAVEFEVVPGTRGPRREAREATLLG